MLNTLDLGNYFLNIGQESIRVMVVQDVHIHSLVTASKECFAVLLGLDLTADSCKHQSSGVDSLKITSGHLQYNRVCGWDYCDNLGTSLYASASLVLLWFV